MSLDSYWDFLNSNFVIASVTFIAGAVALYVYKRRQWDNKKDAANIILLEIQNAERQLKQIQENIKKESLDENLYAMKTENWNKYKYLFVRNFDRDEWDALTDFFHKCQLVDDAVSHQSSFFQKNEEQLRMNMQRIIVDYIKKIAEEENNGAKEKILNEAKKFQTEYLQHPDLTLYSPKKPLNDVKSYMENWNINISQTTIGTKLKYLAGLNK